MEFNKVKKIILNYIIENKNKWNRRKCLNNGNTNQNWKKIKWCMITK